MSASESPRYFAHPSAYIDEPCTIGADTKIWHYSHVSAHCVIGTGCSIGQNVFVAPHTRIGDNVKIQNNVSVYEGVEIEDEVFCGPSMVFTNVQTPRSGTPRRGAEHYLRTLVRRGASIGANATIVCGNTIGEYAFVGAGAVVTKDVPDYGLVYGNPARLHGYACRCGITLTFLDERAACGACRRRYEKRNGLVTLTEAP
jgi:UDP-2-acetamido-3-amino-2,3-dideoxy-glucuronate N-acetyltransferase